MGTSHIYPGAHTLNAYITIKGCDEAIKFYKEAFGATENSRLMMPDGKIGHANIEIEGSMLMLSDEVSEWKNKSPKSIGGNSMVFSLYVKDVDASFQRALEAGAVQTMPVEDMFYGDRVGEVEDPFGYRWMIATHKETLSNDEIQKRAESMFSSHMQE